MKIEIDNSEYKLVIVKKKSTKNTYIRVKDNLDIYVTSNYFTTDKYILDLINKNLDSIRKMLDKAKKRLELKEENKEYFYYLGKKYDIVYLNNEGITFGENKVFVNPKFDLNKWYKKRAEIIFQEELDKMYQSFCYEIPYPSLTIRSMKTRWGVCNVKTKRVTLNLELIKRDIKYLDYVIIHELSHLLYPNHSKDFWNCVHDNMKDYKVVRKELKSDE